MCESQVSGCQLQAWYAVIAQAIPSPVRPPLNVRVLVDVIVVVEVDEVVAGRLAEDGDHRQQQKAADGQHAVRPPDLRRGARGEAIDRPGGHLLWAFRIARPRPPALLRFSRHLPSSQPGRCYIGTFQCLGQIPDQVAGHQRHLAQLLGGQVAGQAVQMDAQPGGVERPGAGRPGR